MRRLNEVIHVKRLEWYVAPSAYLMDIGDDGSHVKRKKVMVMMVTLLVMIIMLIMMNQKVLQKCLLLKVELALGYACNL